MSFVRRLLAKHHDGAPPEPAAVELSTVEAGQLATLFAAPRWLRDLGRTAWLLVGCFALVAGIVWLLGATYTIVGPVVAAMILATVTIPIVGRLGRHRVPRAAGAAIVLLGLLALGVLVVVIVIGGITAQDGNIAKEAKAAADQAESWLTSVGVNESGAASAKSSVEQDVPQIISALTKGVINGIAGLASLVFGLSLAMLSVFFLLKDVPQIISALTKGVINGIAGLASLAFGLSLAMLSVFFLLKDGPSLRRWVDGHLGVPQPVAKTITGGIIRSLRGYFRGVTLVAAFNGVVVALAALVLGVPLAGTIGVVTFVTAYIPYIGAFVSGAFAVVIALGGEGTSTALIMLVVVILANGLLQNLVQPFAMGSALDLHPLAVLVITIAAGCVFGMIGLILAAPLTSAAVHITRDLAKARASVEAAEVEDALPPVTT